MFQSQDVGSIIQNPIVPNDEPQGSHIAGSSFLWPWLQRKCAVKGPKWYALFVATGEEDKVKERLLYKFNEGDFKILVPKRKMCERKGGIWETKIRTLLPGYVLVNAILGTDEYYALKGTPGLIKVLKDRYDPLEIDEQEISLILKLMCNREVIETSNVVLDGSRVIVIDGPLLGMEGMIQSIDKRKGRAKVKLNFLGEDRVVELSVSMVQTA